VFITAVPMTKLRGGGVRGPIHRNLSFSSIKNKRLFVLNEDACGGAAVCCQAATRPAATALPLSMPAVSSDTPWRRDRLAPTAGVRAEGMALIPFFAPKLSCLRRD
jgi:hypothetical protein